MITDNTAKWKVKKFSTLNVGNGIPVGFEYISMNPNIPQGSLPLFGGVYDREIYSDLWAWVQQQAGYVISDEEWQGLFYTNDGNVPFYSIGDGNSTFRVPSISCWVRGASGIEEVSSYLQAGLPSLPDMSHTHTRGTMNITGSFTSGPDSYDLTNNITANCTGAFSSAKASFNKNRISTNNNEKAWTATFDASKSWTGETSKFTPEINDTFYGTASTVQPKTLVGMWLVKAYGTITNVGNIETSNLLQLVENSRIKLAVW